MNRAIFTNVWRCRARKVKNNAKAVYYGLLDHVQQAWPRFKASEVGSALIWLAPWVLKFWWLAIKASVALFILVWGAMFFLLLIVTGNGKAATESLTKITLVVVGLFVATKVVENKPEVAAAIKALIKP